MSKPRIAEGRSWQFDAPVTACAFDATGVSAFALGDGTIRLAREDQEQCTVVEAHSGAVLTLCAHPGGGFLSGGDDGRLVHCTADGATTVLYSASGRWIESIAVAADTGLIACTAGKIAVLIDGAQNPEFAHGSTAAWVAFDPKGRRLAVAHYNGASLWWARSTEQTPKVLEWKGSHTAITFSPDGKFLVSAMQEKVLHGWRLEDGADMRMAGYPGKVKSLAWERRGRMLFTGGAGRVIGWQFTGRNGPMGREPVEIGQERDAVVSVVAASPVEELVVAGSEDGAVFSQRLEVPGADFLTLDASEISALAVDEEGVLAAFGDIAGFAAIVPVAD